MPSRMESQQERAQFKALKGHHLVLCKGYVAGVLVAITLLKFLE